MLNRRVLSIAMGGLVLVAGTVLVLRQPDAFSFLRAQSGTPTADMQITKIYATPSVNVGTDVVFTLTAKNNGPNIASNVTFEDTISDGMILVSSSFPSSCYSVGLMYRCSIGNMGPGAQLVITQRYSTSLATVCDSLLGGPARVYTSTAETNTSNNSGVGYVTAYCPRADLEITKIYGSPTVRKGNNATFTINVKNKGPDIASGVVARDPLPGMLLTSTTATNCYMYNQEHTCNLGNIGVGATFSYTNTFATGSSPLCDPGSISTIFGSTDRIMCACTL